MCGKERDEYYDEEEEATREWEMEIMDALTIPDEDDLEKNLYHYPIAFPSLKTERDVVIDERRLKIIGVVLAFLTLEQRRADIEADLGRELDEYLAEITEKKEEAHNLIDAMLDYARKCLFEYVRGGYEDYETYEQAVADYNRTIDTIIGYMLKLERVMNDALDRYFISDITDLWSVDVEKEAEKLYEKKMEDAPRLGITEEIKVDEEQFLMWVDDFEEKLKEWEKWIEDFKNWFFARWREVK